MNAKLTHYHGTNEQAGNYSKCPEEPLRGRDRDKLFQVTRMEKKVRKLKCQHYNCYYFCTFQQPLLEAQKEREKL